MVQKYRKKPVVIEAALVEHGQTDSLAKWCNGRSIYTPSGKSSGIDIPTLEGIMRASMGDYIIKGVKGEFYPCKPDIFEATYEAVK
jgi:hypothetical protein